MLTLLAVIVVGLTAQYVAARERYGREVQKILQRADLQKVAALELGMHAGQFSLELSKGTLSGAALLVLNPHTDGELGDWMASQFGITTFNDWVTLQQRALRESKTGLVLPADRERCA